MTSFEQAGEALKAFMKQRQAYEKKYHVEIKDE